MVLSAGCRTISKGITESVLEREEAKEWRVQYGSRMHYALTDETLENMDFEGTLQAGETTVRYQRGLGPQAQCIADRTAALLEQVHDRTGVTISTHSTIYLLRFDQRPQNFDILLTVEPNEFPLPLFVRAGAESCQAIIAQNRSYPYLFVHELVETSLASETGARVLPDLTWGALGLNVHVNNYTRWFRDGLANYAGYVAYQIVARDMPREQRLYHRQTLLHTTPFSSLARIGDDLFSWPQSSHTKDERTYYSAALGLFLLIADTYGEEAIREIVREIAIRKAVNGPDLIEITNHVLDADVRTLAADFEFPDVGVELERMSPALALNHGVAVQEGLFVQAVEEGSAAARAGLQPGDVITAGTSTSMTNLFDFELALFQAKDKPAVSLTVQRPDAEAQIIELSVTESAGSARTSGGRRRQPLEEGRIEFRASVTTSFPR